MNTALKTLGLIAVMLLGGFFLLNHYIYQEKQADDPLANVRPVFTGDTVQFTCGEAGMVSLRQSQESQQVVELTVASTSYVLESVVSGSGARYVGGEVEFWEHGEVATVRIGTDELPPCQVEETEGMNDRRLMQSNWQLTDVAENDAAVPLEPEAFLLSFDQAGNVSIVTDCNNHGGKYRAVQGSLTLYELVGTQMFCEGSGETIFMDLLSRATVYDIAEDGTLFLRGENVVMSYMPVRNP
jgi:membrane-bound inhibitor of C-type lysozyme